MPYPTVGTSSESIKREAHWLEEMMPVTIRGCIKIVNAGHSSFKASSQGRVAADHPGEFRPRVRLRENGIEILFHQRRAFHGNSPFLDRERLLSNRVPEARPSQQLSDPLVVAPALQPADQIRRRPGLYSVQPRPRTGHIQRM